MNRTVTAFVGLGSNMDDRVRMLRMALNALTTIDGARVDRPRGIASLYETSPVGGPAGQPNYLNSVVRVEARIEPLALLERLLLIEGSLGRTRGMPWDQRVIDLDLLLYGQVVLDHPKLTLPHPRLHQRRFVLEPLSEIAPDAMHPRLGKAIGQLADDLRISVSCESIEMIDGPNWPMELVAAIVPP